MTMAGATHEISLRSGVLNISLPTACRIGEPVVEWGNGRGEEDFREERSAGISRSEFQSVAVQVAASVPKIPRLCWELGMRKFPRPGAVLEVPTR